MLNLNAIDGLTGLRAALEAPEAERLDVFRRQVMEPLRPFWEPFLGWMPGRPDTGDPLLDAARAFAYYVPEGDVAEGRAALERIERAGTWPACVDAVRTAWERLAPAAHGIALDTVNFTFVLGDRKTMTSQIGDYTGSGAMPGTVLIMAWPTDYSLPRMPSATAHELNHNIRFSFEPFTPQTTLGQYMVAEGLAEAFAAELFGDDRLGPWADALTPQQVAEFTPRYRENVELTGFNEVRGYIFGDWSARQFGHAAYGVPDFAGYTFGYRIVRGYLARTGRTAAEATYVPWREIVEGSGVLA